MISTANFFWNGHFSLYEYACISSFIKNNFKVQVFAFDDKMIIPDGATLRDARDIVSEELLYAYTLSGQKGSMAGFADAFRIHLLKKEGGWWFDADVLCLKSADAFAETVKRKEKKVSIGYQNSKYINNGVIYANDERFVDKLLLELEKIGYDGQWGDTGPKLITTAINTLGYKDYIDPVEQYYPIDGPDLIKLLDPYFNIWSHSKVSSSSAVHLWNDVIKHLCVPKNMLPPEGSFLRERFLAYCPELKHIPSLPFETVKRLFDYRIIKLKYEETQRNPIDNITAFSKKARQNFKKIFNKI
jgi:hypothetical protein